MKYLLIVLVFLFLWSCNSDEDEYCFITAPVNDAQIEHGDTVLILVNPINSGQFKKVELYVDSTLEETLYGSHWYYLLKTINYYWQIDYGYDVGKHSITSKTIFQDSSSISDEISIEIIRPINIKTKNALLLSPFCVTLKGFVQVFDNTIQQCGFYLSNENAAPDSLDTVIECEIGPSLLIKTIVDLQPGTNYYYRTFVRTGNKITVGNTIHFQTKNYVDVEIVNHVFTDDRDENKYQTTRIGEQTWMAENLAYLPSINHPKQSSFFVPNYYVYDYAGIYPDSARTTKNYQKYGVLYNWNAAIDACPVGWHLPTSDEWLQLANYILESKHIEIPDYKKYSLFNVGYYLKSTTGWYNEGNGLNGLGFNALPGGGITSSDFSVIEKSGFWWTSTDKDNNNKKCFIMNYYSDDLEPFHSLTVRALSIRCIKD